MIKTIQDMEEYLKTFNKKFLRFKSRAPIYFTFQATPFAVSLYHDSEFSEESLITEFTINYEVSVEDFIFNIREYLREHEYPKLVRSTVLRLDPSSSDIQALMVKNNIPFEEAFSLLSIKKKKEVFVLDKIDLSKNRLVISGSNKFLCLYQVDMPVLVFVRNLKTLEEKARWAEFEKHCQKVSK